MSRRPHGSLSLLTSMSFLLLLLAGFDRPAMASATNTSSKTNTVAFRLTNTTATPVSEMYFDLVPTDTIIPPLVGTDPQGNPIEGSPMKALPSSMGIDVSSAYVLLTDDPAGSDMERMFLLFGYKPDPTAADGAVPFLPLVDDNGGRLGELSPGGTFDFELNLAQGSLGYLLKSAIDGLSLSVLDVPSPEPEPSPGHGGNPGTDPGTQVPEPSALLLWGVIGVGAMVVVRRRRSALRLG